MENGGAVMFNYDWFFGPAFEQQKQAARWFCALQHFPDLDPETARKDEAFQRFHDELETRMLIYLRDGFSYEIKRFAEVATRSHLVFECVPVDEQYKVGAFVVTVPFDEIVRVEVYAVHPEEKPDELPRITGFRASPEPGEFSPAEQKPQKPARPGR